MSWLCSTERSKWHPWTRSRLDFWRWSRLSAWDAPPRSPQSKEKHGSSCVKESFPACQWGCGSRGSRLQPPLAPSPGAAKNRGVLQQRASGSRLVGPPPADLNGSRGRLPGSPLVTQLWRPGQSPVLQPFQGCEQHLIPDDIFSSRSRHSAGFTCLRWNSLQQRCLETRLLEHRAVLSEISNKVTRKTH